jgi:hypothetical protein
MERTLENVYDYYGGPKIKIPDYPGVNSPLYYVAPLTPA